MLKNTVKLYPPNSIKFKYFLDTWAFYRRILNALSIRDYNISNLGSVSNVNRTLRNNIRELLSNGMIEYNIDAKKGSLGMFSITDKGLILLSKINLLYCMLGETNITFLGKPRYEHNLIDE